MFRSLLLVASLVLLAVQGLLAQTGPALLPVVEVAGSRLASTFTAPATVLDRADLERSGRGTLTELLRDLPSLALTGITDQVSISTTRGAVAADLFGLGAGNTLVLMDGRRVSVSANAFDQTTFVDLNRFAPASLERVEIIRGGASAVHGADAVAGVLNLVTRRPAPGGEVTLSYGNAFATDVRERRFDFAVGAVRGAASLGVTAEFYDRGDLMARDRWFSRTADLTSRFTQAYDYFPPLRTTNPGAYQGFDGRYVFSGHALLSVAGGQINGENGVNLPGLASGAAITALPGTAANPTAWRTQVTPAFGGSVGSGTGGTYSPTVAAAFVPPELTRNDPDARNLFDFQSVNGSLPAVARGGGSLAFRYALPGGAELFATGIGQRRRTHTTLTPARLTLTVPRTNFYNPFGVDVVAQWSPLAAVPRRSLNEDDSFALVGGVRSAPDASLRWETAVTFSRDEFNDVFTGGFSAPRTNVALARTDASALNPFGGSTYRHDSALWRELLQPTEKAGCADLASADARLGGELGRLPAGPVRAVAYAEVRRESLAQSSDLESQSGRVLAASNFGRDAAWSREVAAFAAEAEAPLLRTRTNAPAALLSLHLAARVEYVAHAPDSGVRPAATLVGRPAAWLRVHVSEAKTFRAPTLLQLHAPQSVTLTNSAPDPRRPFSLTGDTFDGPNVGRSTRTGGNPGLSAETGVVRQAGVVVVPPIRSLAGLTLEATWFRYDLSDVITGPSVSDVLLNELGATGALVVREPGGETYRNATGVPIAVLNGPAGEFRTVQPGETVSVPGRLREITTHYYNLARRSLAGTDLAVRWRHDFGPCAGVWTLGSSATYFDANSSAGSPSSPLRNVIGSPGLPRWRLLGTLDGQRGGWQTGAAWRYIDSSGDFAADGLYIKPYRTLALHVAYTFRRELKWLRGYTVGVSVDDAFDESPPLQPDPPVGYNYNIVPRPQGRSWRVMVKRTW